MTLAATFPGLDGSEKHPEDRLAPGAGRFGRQTHTLPVELAAVRFRLSDAREH